MNDFKSRLVNNYFIIIASHVQKWVFFPIDGDIGFKFEFWHLFLYILYILVLDLVSVATGLALLFLFQLQS